MSWESQGVALLTASVVRPFRVGGVCVVDSSPPEGPAPGMTARGLDAIRFTYGRQPIAVWFAFRSPLRQIDGGMGCSRQESPSDRFSSLRVARLCQPQALGRRTKS